jgi:hypothetical protein
MTLKIGQEDSSIVKNNIVHDIAVLENTHDWVLFALLTSKQRRIQIEII